jgi:trehalose 6-phosphate phosphatase
MTAALAPLRADPTHAAICSDFDGTLSLIVEDPAAARLLDDAYDVLDRLAARYARVAVVSGRPAAFVAEFLPPSVVVSGLYGLEQIHDGTRIEHLSAGAWTATIAAVAAVAESDGPRGMVVEPKGLSLTLHYRGRPGLADEVAAWASAQAGAVGLSMRPARMSVELHPPIDVDKGTAVRDLVGDLSAALFVGDDQGDLPAFAALDELAGEGVAVVKVAVASAEMPPALLDAADVVVDGPAGTLELLRSLSR